MKEIGNDNSNLNKRLYYKKVAAILLVALFVFFGYSVISTLSTVNEESFSDKLMWNDGFKSCQKESKNSCEYKNKVDFQASPDFSQKDNSFGSKDGLYDKEVSYRLNLAKELEEFQLMNQNGIIKVEEFYDL